MDIKIAFDPESIKKEDEAWPAFDSEYPVVLRLWALYKQRYVTSQHFRESLVQFDEMLFKAQSKDHPDCHMYENIDDFMSWMRTCGLYGSIGGPHYSEFRTFALIYWDYFNPNIQRQITIKFKAIREVEVEYSK